MSTIPTLPWDFLCKAIPNTSVDEFRFGIDVGRLFKAKQQSGVESKRRYLEGVASTPDEDLQNEIVVQNGLDLRYFLRHGYLNDDHKPGPEHKVGRPTNALVKRVKDSKGNMVTGLWLEGYLFPQGTHDGADALWTLGKALEESGDDHRLGFSIQGKVLKRDGQRILKAWIQDVAVTASPVNTATWLQFCAGMSKSLWANAEDVEVIHKSLGVDLYKSQMLDDSNFDQAEKTLSTVSGAALIPESLDSDIKLNKNKTSQSQDGDDFITKAIRLAYVELRQRGYSESLARKGALLVAARQTLS